MVSPITERPCLYYRTLVWEWKQNGKNKNWVKIVNECMHLPFFVDDNTGRLLVDPRGADLDLHRACDEEFCDSFFTTKDSAPDTVRSFLARHGIITNNKIKVEEYCIKPKNSLFILGTLGDNAGLEVSPQPIRDAETINSISIQGFSLSLNSLSVTRDSDDLPVGSLAPRLPLGFDGHHDVVRLPSDSAPVKSSDMTQQQKIAAALLKAGIASPLAWAAAGIPVAGGVQVLTDPAQPNGTGNGDN